MLRLIETARLCRTTRKSAERNSGRTGEDTVEPEICTSQLVSSSGDQVRIREVTADDSRKLLEYFESLSATSAYHRFLGVAQWARQQDLEALVAKWTSDPAHYLAFVAESAEGEAPIIGETCCAVGEGAKPAEFSLSVADGSQNQGIGTLLLNRLLEKVMELGFERIEAQILASNHRALRFFIARGFTPSLKSPGILRLSRLVTPSIRFASV